MGVSLCVCGTPNQHQGTSGDKGRLLCCLTSPVCVCVCVCVWRLSYTVDDVYLFRIDKIIEKEIERVCLCVCERDREREREGV